MSGDSETEPETVAVLAVKELQRVGMPAEVQTMPTSTIHNQPNSQNSKPTQTAPRKTRSKRRQEWDKLGKYQYIIRKIRGLDQKLDVVLKLERTIVKGLEHQFNFDQEFIEDAVCQDEFDRAILELLRGSGPDGLLPRDIAKRLGSRRITPWKVTLRLRRINQRLQKTLGQKAVEKRGMPWALSDFMMQAWGSTKNELQEA